MISDIWANLSALEAFGTKLGVTGNNVANAQSEAFKKSRTVLEASGPQGVQAHVDRVPTPGPTVVESMDGKRIERQLSNVDLAEEMVQTIPTCRGYEANLRVIETRDEMLGTLMDMIG